MQRWPRSPLIFNTAFKVLTVNKQKKEEYNLEKESIMTIIQISCMINSFVPWYPSKRIVYRHTNFILKRRNLTNVKRRPILNKGEEG